MRQLFPWLFPAPAKAVPLSSDIFAAIDHAPLIEHPYPHLVVEDAVPRAIADAFLAEMLSLEVLCADQPPRSNVRFPLPSPQALADPRISEAWKATLRTCLDASNPSSKPVGTSPAGDFSGFRGAVRTDRQALRGAALRSAGP